MKDRLVRPIMFHFSYPVHRNSTSQLQTLIRIHPQVKIDFGAVDDHNTRLYILQAWSKEDWFYNLFNWQGRCLMMAPNLPLSLWSRILAAAANSQISKTHSPSFIYHYLKGPVLGLRHNTSNFPWWQEDIAHLVQYWENLQNSNGMEVETSSRNVGES